VSLPMYSCMHAWIVLLETFIHPSTAPVPLLLVGATSNGSPLSMH